MAIFSVLNFVLIIILLSISTIPVSNKFTVLISVFFIQIVAYLVVRLKNVSETDLIVSENKYRILAENMSDVIWIYNVTLGKYIYVSPSVEQLTGYSVEEALNLKFEENFEPKSAELIKNQLDIAINEFAKNPGAKNTYYHELEQRRKDGQLIWIETTVKVRANLNGEIEVNGLSRNIYKRKLFEYQLQKYAEELNQSNKDKDRFVSILAHDLKNPLTTIAGFAKILLKNHKNYDGEKIEKHLKIVYNTSVQTYNLLEDLLLWSKSIAGKLPVEPKEIDLNLLCNDLIQKSIEQIRAKEIEVKCHGYEIPMLYADLNMVKVILRNLISNAIKFTPKRGSISISYKIDGNMAVISVFDTGVGIPEAVQSKIWDLTTPYSTPGTNNEKGSGYGLMFCKELVEKNGGKIWVESIPGEGSNFKFTLPLA